MFKNYFVFSEFCVAYSAVRCILLFRKFKNVYSRFIRKDYCNNYFTGLMTLKRKRIYTVMDNEENWVGFHRG